MAKYQADSKMTDGDKIAEAIWHNLQTSAEEDNHGESANIVDGLFAIARSIRYLADTIKESK